MNLVNLKNLMKQVRGRRGARSRVIERGESTEVSFDKFGIKLSGF